MSIHKSLLLAFSVAVLSSGCGSVGKRNLANHPALKVQSVDYSKSAISVDWNNDSMFAEHNLRGQAELAIHRYVSNTGVSKFNAVLMGRENRLNALSSPELDRVYVQVNSSVLRIVGVKTGKQFGEVYCHLESSMAGREVHYNRNGKILYDGFFVLKNKSGVPNPRIAKLDRNNELAFMDKNTFEIKLSDKSKCDFDKKDWFDLVENMESSAVSWSE